MRIVSLEQAAALIPDDATVSVCGAWMLVPDALLAAIGKRFRESGCPHGLTATFLLCPGGTPDQPGIEHLAEDGLLRRTIGGSYPNLPDSKLRKLIAAGSVEAYNLPAGMIANWYRETGGGRPGALYRNALGTFADPRVEGPGMNEAAREPLVEVVHLGGIESLFLPARRFDAALIRATTADTHGNLTMEDEPATLTAFAQAAAARATGGIVIAQVKRIAQSLLDPHAVKVPGTLVDYVAVAEDPLQAGGIRFDPAICGQQIRPLGDVDTGGPLEQWLARRAAAWLSPGDTVLLGYGISAYVPWLLARDGRDGDYTFAIEQGSLGGLPLTDFGFGSSVNPKAILDSNAQFDLFQGGCFDSALLSFLQVDPRGRVNVHRLDARPALSAGIGGFLDVAGAAPRLVLLGYFTAGGLDIALDGGRVAIRREGRMRKFVNRIDHVSFDPAYSRCREILYVTERATLRYAGAGLEIVEVAPGVDPERDVLGQMDFPAQLQCANATP